MEKESSFGLMRAHMMVISSKTIFTVRVSIDGQMEECTEVNGLITKWKEKEHSPGVMEEDTSECIKTIKSMGTEPLNGQMEESTSVNGAKESNTEKGSTLKKENAEKESGKWARELNGSKMKQPND